MIYKLKLDILAKIIPAYVTDEAARTILMNIVTLRRSHMRFQKSLFKADTYTGDDISGMVEAYEEELEAKKAEAAEFTD
tara:strand:+ start:360 stop:596 length:237 start_codon:yes stop_codon:yes gene_type:complete